MRRGVPDVSRQAPNHGLAASINNEELRFFPSQKARTHFTSEVARHRASLCSDHKCRALKSCCHIGCPDDGMQPLTHINLFYSYTGFDYFTFVGVIAGPLTVGVSQYLQATPDLATVNVITYTGTVIPPPAGMIQILFPNGMGIDATTPDQSIFVLSGVKDSNFPTVAGAHRLNTRYIVRTTPTAGQWTMAPVSVSDMKSDDYIQIKRFLLAADPALTVPYPQVVLLDNVNCPEQTINWALSSFSELNLARRINIECAVPPSNACGLCKRSPGSCNDKRCNKHCLVMSVKSARVEQHARNMGVPLQRIGNKANRLFEHIEKFGKSKKHQSLTLGGGYTGIGFDHKKGHIIRARNGDELNLGQHAHSARRMILDAQREIEELAAYADRVHLERTARHGRQHQQQQQLHRPQWNRNGVSLSSGANGSTLRQYANAAFETVKTNYMKAVTAPVDAPVVTEAGITPGNPAAAADVNQTEFAPMLLLPGIRIALQTSGRAGNIATITEERAPVVFLQNEEPDVNPAAVPTPEIERSTVLRRAIKDRRAAALAAVAAGNGNHKSGASSSVSITTPTAGWAEGDFFSANGGTTPGGDVAQQLL